MKQARKTKVEQARDWLLKEIRNGNFPRGTACPRSANWPNRSGSAI